MNPYTRMTWTLLGALLIWIPIAFAMLSGRFDLPTAGIYFLVALAIAYAGVGIVSHLASGYSESSSRLELAKRQIEELERRRAAEQPRRRATDEPQDAEQPDD